MGTSWACFSWGSLRPLKKIWNVLTSFFPFFRNSGLFLSFATARGLTTRFCTFSRATRVDIGDARRTIRQQCRMLYGFCSHKMARSRQERRRLLAQRARLLGASNPRDFAKSGCLWLLEQRCPRICTAKLSAANAKASLTLRSRIDRIKCCYDFTCSWHCKP